MNDVVYVIKGRTGEYADTCEWMVEAHLDRDNAIKRVAQLNDKLVQLGIARPMTIDYYDRDLMEAAHDQIRELDGLCYSDYTGVEYELYVIELKG
jgi:hypothetical protein